MRCTSITNVPKEFLCSVFFFVRLELSVEIISLCFIYLLELIDDPVLVYKKKKTTSFIK